MTELINANLSVTSMKRSPSRHSRHGATVYKVLVDGLDGWRRAFVDSSHGLENISWYIKLKNGVAQTLNERSSIKAWEALQLKELREEAFI